MVGLRSVCGAETDVNILVRMQKYFNDLDNGKKER